MTPRVELGKGPSHPGYSLSVFGNARDQTPADHDIANIATPAVSGSRSMNGIVAVDQETCLVYLLELEANNSFVMIALDAS